MNTINSSANKASVQKPWLQFYPEPLRNFVPSEDSLIEFILKNNTDHDQEIIEYYGRKLTLNQIMAETEKVAKAMSLLNVKENDSIIVFLRAVPEFLFIFLAAEKLGLSVVCNDGLPEERSSAIRQGDIKIAFAHDHLPAEEEKVFYDAGLEHIVLVSPYTFAEKSEIPDYVENSINALYTGELACDSRNISWADFIASAETVKYDVSVTKNIDRSLYCAYTSGSTGPSKQVIHSSRTIVGLLNQLVIPGGLGFRLRVLLTMFPPALVAVVNSIMLFNIISSNYLILDPFCDIDDIDIEFMRYRPNQMIAVPMMASILMDSKRIPEDYPMNDLYVLGGGADPVHNKWLDKIQAYLAQHGSPAIYSMCYGLSEVGSTATNPRPGAGFKYCGGGIPMRGTTIGIFEPETFNELDYDQIGEVCVSGPANMVGYSSEEDTAKTMKVHPDGKVWIHTGDFGRMNPEGELFVYSRGLNKRFGGGYLYTTIMENKVIEVPGLADCFYVIVPDKDHEGYFLPYLYIVPENGVELADVEDKIRARVLEHEQPVEIFVVEKREYFHFKTNRRILAGKILAGEH